MGILFQFSEGAYKLHVLEFLLRAVEMHLYSEIYRIELYLNQYFFDMESVVVLQTTAGWRKAPALAQRVCTRGLASLRSISLKNTMNTARFRVVRAAGA